MTYSYTKLFSRILAATLALAFVTACAPPATAPTSSNLTMEMRRVHSALEQQDKSMKALAKQLEQLEMRVQLQSDQLDQLQQTPQTGQTGYQPAGLPQQFGTTAASAQGEGSPTEVYLQAFGDYASGRYQAAIRGFETFLQRFPNNSYASNAQFWLGDCYFNQQQYSLAAVEFERVLKEYPSAPKNPDALLKIAIAQLQLGESDEARQTINTLSQRYPKSSATQKAQELAIP